MFNLSARRKPYTPGKWLVRNWPGLHVRRLGKKGDTHTWKMWRHRMRGLRMFREWKLTEPKLRDRPAPKR